MSISSIPSRKTRSSVPAAAICRALKPPSPGTKPRSSAPTREAAPLEDAVAVPALLHGAEIDRRLSRERRDVPPVGPRKDLRADEDERALGMAHDVAESCAG